MLDNQDRVAYSRSQLFSAADRTLVDRAVDGDVNAFEMLVRRHGPLVRAYVIRILGSATEADDIVHDTFVTAWTEFPTIGNPDGVEGWLMNVARLKSIDRMRANRHAARVDESVVQVPFALLRPRHPEGQGRMLSHDLSDISSQQRRCWELRDFGEYAYVEIAEELDIPVSIVCEFVRDVRTILSHDVVTFTEHVVWRRSKRTVQRQSKCWRVVDGRNIPAVDGPPGWPKNYRRSRRSR